MNNFIINHIAVFLATCCYVSVIPEWVLNRLPFLPKDTMFVKRWTGAGLFGSLLGCLTYLSLPYAVANHGWVFLSCVAVSVGASHLAERHFQKKDDSRIIIDEWVGMWVACFGLPQTLQWPILAAFILFRVFDVWKGPWMQWLQNLPGGLGIVSDDLLAGLMARLVVAGLIHIF